MDKDALIKKFETTYGGGGDIRVSATREGNNLRIAVSDSGVGMTEAQLERLRAALAASESTEAETGYGLFSVDKRIKLYYNQPEGLTIEGAEGAGATVSFSVPIRG